MSHAGVSCDGCGVSAFGGLRHKCSVCFDYDLCHNCFSMEVSTLEHSPDHQMRTIAPPEVDDFGRGDAFLMDDTDLFGCGGWGSGRTGARAGAGIMSGLLSALESDGSAEYSCPYCGQGGLTEELLCDHTIAEHAFESRPQICPICAERDESVTPPLIRDFQGHMLLRHRGDRFRRRTMRGFTGSGGGAVRGGGFGGGTGGGSGKKGLSSGGIGAGDTLADLLAHFTAAKKQKEMAPSSARAPAVKVPIQPSSRFSSPQQSPAAKAASPKVTSPLHAHIKSPSNTLTIRERKKLDNIRQRRSAYVCDLILSTLLPE